MKKVAGAADIVVGRDGVLLSKEGRSAVFLPQVATEQGWNREEMLDNLCLKAGLDGGMLERKSTVFNLSGCSIQRIRNSNNLMTISLLAIGLISILGQVVLLRELNVSFYGIELIYLLALGIWLFWTAVGAVIGRRIRFPSLNHIAVLFIIFGIAIPLDIVFIRSSRLLFGGIPGAYLTFFQQLIVVVISILPAGVVVRPLVPVDGKGIRDDGQDAGLAYAIESAGGLIGGLFSTLFLIVGITELLYSVCLCPCLRQ